MLNSSYVITLDKLTDKIVNEIAKHKNLEEQIKEWRDSGMVEKDWDLKN